MTSQGSFIRAGLLVFLLPFLIWILFLFVIPHVELLRFSFLGHRTGTFTLANYTKFFAQELYRNTFLRTAIFSIIATLITMIVSFPTAFFVTKFVGVGKRSILMLIIIIPFWISELIRAFAWMTLLRETGTISYLLQLSGLTSQNVELLYNDAAIMVGLVYASMLFMIVPIASTISTLDDNIIEAAYDLGGSFFSTMREVIIPYAAPGIATGCIVVFMINLGNLITVTLLGGKDSLWFTELIYNQFIIRFNWNQGSAFGFLLLSLSTLIVWIGLKVTGQELSKVLK
jgi:spermidine/putrescine transport system permease protein